MIRGSTRKPNTARRPTSSSARLVIDEQDGARCEAESGRKDLFVMEVQEWMRRCKEGIGCAEVVLRKVDVSRRYLSGEVVEMSVMRGRGRVDCVERRAK